MLGKYYETLLPLKSVQKHHTILILLLVDCSDVSDMLKIDFVAAKDLSAIIKNVEMQC